MGWWPIAKVRIFVWALGGDRYPRSADGNGFPIRLNPDLPQVVSFASLKMVKLRNHPLPRPIITTLRS